MPAGYPRIDPPHKLPDGSYIIRITKAPGQLEEVPCADLKVARDTHKVLERAIHLLVPRDERDAPGVTGRPISLTPDLQAKFYGRIATGQSFQQACDCCRIDYSTFKKWRHRAEEGDEPFASFFSGLKEHRAEGNYQLRLRLVRGELGWQSAARLLEAMDKGFIRRQRIEGIPGGGSPVQIVISQGKLEGGEDVSDTIAEAVTMDPGLKREGEGSGETGTKSTPGAKVVSVSADTKKLA